MLLLLHLHSRLSWVKATARWDEKHLKFLDLVRFILEVWRYVWSASSVGVQWVKRKREVLADNKRHFLLLLSGKQWIGHIQLIICQLSVCDVVCDIWRNYNSLDSFTVSLHNPNGRRLPAVRVLQGDCQRRLKPMEIRTGHVSPLCIATRGIPNLY